MRSSVTPGGNRTHQLLEPLLLIACQSSKISAIKTAILSSMSRIFVTEYHFVSLPRRPFFELTNATIRTPEGGR
jgi:hypothetical protein